MKVQRPLFWPCVIVLISANAALAAHDPRQLPTSPIPPSQVVPPASTTTPTSPANAPTSTTTPTPTPTTTQPPTTAPDTTTTPQTPNIGTSATAGPSTPAQTQPTATQPTSTPPANAPNPGTPVPSPTPIVATSVNEDGSTITITSTPPVSATSTPSSTAQPSDSDEGGGLSTGSIIGMSVAAGVAVIGIVGFFVWKFTRKRFSDFDDNEAIKWPELNTHSGSGPDSHALPARETGRSGFDTGSEADLSRVDSTTNYSTTNFSTADFGAGGADPYAVPPLPHLNPNQPYRDDPAGASGFYDPYRGPVPGTIEHGAADWQTGEAYPMTQFNQSQARASPAPDHMYGRSSPSPQVAYGGRASPSPQAAYGGRASPSPQAAYGGRASPGPHAAYPAGRASPGPGTAYDAFGAR